MNQVVRWILMSTYNGAQLTLAGIQPNQ